jgi:DNA-3-methyladenine glycosylase II
VKRQVARVLGVDQDVERFEAIVARDPALKKLARPAFRPVVAYSPYAMAGWSVLSQRTRMAQAAKLQIAIAEAAGDVVEIDGDTIASFPRPQSILARDGFKGVQPEKWTRLQAVARAALDGRLERDRLLGMPYEEARADLLAIRGVGAWTADAILVRGCGPTDLLPLAEPRLHEMVGRLYGKRVEEVAERWRPFRTWVSVLLVSEHFELARAMIP